MAPPKKEGKSAAHVFIADPEFAWRPAILEETRDNFGIVEVPHYKDEHCMYCDGGRTAKSKEKMKVNLKDYPHGVLPLQNVDNQGNLMVFPDMVKLPYLHEAAILFNMKARHYEGKPYTRTGDIIIAINPFQWFLDLYTDNKRKYYSLRLVWEAHENDPRDGMEPHVYEVSSLSYKGLAFGRKDQSILVSGESGAGKTETVKICMNHMASVQQGPTTAATSDALDPVVARVVESNPLLEAFGNAKTRRNDNSSRFGKYLQLQFDSTGSNMILTDHTNTKCVLAGSKCDVYLLEKNRLTGHDDPERTYHIFYQLLAAPEDEKAHYWPHLKGKKFEDFKYVQATTTTHIEGETDAQHYKHTVNTLAMVGCTGEKLDTLFRAISIVMQCGNLTFGMKGGEKDKSECTSPKEVKLLSEIMGVAEEVLLLSFTERTMKTKTESFKVPLNPEFAKDAADALAKEIYGKVFLWLVKEINQATAAEINYKGGTMTDFGLIGLLDIFGFESFVVNRFEQLCINYANEKLQQKFTEDVFRAVQDEYEAEGIALDQITYDDNTDVLDLIEGRTGLLALLNEECVRPKGNDEQFVQKALQQNSKSPCLITNKMDRMSFGIHHYAGKVMYDAKQFVARNTDTLPTDLEELAMKSANAIAAAKLEDGDSPAAGDAPAKPGGRAPPKRQKSNLVAPTVWGKYKTQLQSLMTNLRKTQSRYIRCIKPNMAKKPNIMDHIPTVEQLRCAGVIAAVTLARSAFPNKLENNAARLRYAGMWDKALFPTKKTDAMSKDDQLKCDVEAIMNCALECKFNRDKDGNVQGMRPFCVGKTRTYFRAGCLEYLEANRMSGMDTQAVTVQRYVRGWSTRKRMFKLLHAKEEAEREERERKALEHQQRLQREEAERIERENKRMGEFKKYEDQIELIKKQIKETESYKKVKVSDAEERKEIAMKEIEELKEQTGSEARKAAMEPKRIAAQQQKKLEEQTKMIEFLKKENKKIRKDNDKVKDKFSVVKANNDKLIAANEEAGNDFESKDESSQKLHLKNEKLMQDLDDAKVNNKKLKDDCMKRQDDYMTQAETRLEYQKTMARILNMIQDTSKEAQIVEDTVVLALECEAEAKSIMAALEAETAG